MRNYSIDDDEVHLLHACSSASRPMHTLLFFRAIAMIDCSALMTIVRQCSPNAVSHNEIAVWNSLTFIRASHFCVGTFIICVNNCHFTLLWRIRNFLRASNKSAFCIIYINKMECWVHFSLRRQMIKNVMFLGLFNWRAVRMVESMRNYSFAEFCSFVFFLLCSLPFSDWANIYGERGVRAFNEQHQFDWRNSF